MKDLRGQMQVGRLGLPITDSNKPEPPPGVFKIVALLPMSAQMLCEAIELRDHVAQHEQEVRIGPVHGPPMPARLALRRRIGGRPFARYRRTA